MTRQVLAAAGGAAAVVAAMLVLPLGAVDDEQAWRAEAVHLATSLAASRQYLDPAGAGLSSDLADLGYRPVANVAGQPSLDEDEPGDEEAGEVDVGEVDAGEVGEASPTDDDDPGRTVEPEPTTDDDEQPEIADSDTAEDGEEPTTPSTTPSPEADPDDDVAETTRSTTPPQPEPSPTRTADPEPGSEESGGSPGGADPSEDAGGDGWERMAQDLAEALAASDDPAARELFEALRRAGFDPADAEDPEQRTEDRDTDDGEGSADSAVGELLWEADVETGDDSQFTGNEPQNVGAPEPEVVSDPDLVRSGDHAMAFTVPGGGERSEFVPGVEVVEGDELWFSFSTLLADNFPVDEDGWQVIMQWHHDGLTGSPPIELDVENGQYSLAGGWDSGEEPWDVPIGPASTGAYVDWTFHVVFASDADALIEVWQNSTQVIDDYSPPAGTLYDGQGNYLKIGYYRSGEIGQEGTLIHDNWVIGTTAQSVGLDLSRTAPRDLGNDPVSRSDSQDGAMQ